MFNAALPVDVAIKAARVSVRIPSKAAVEWVPVVCLTNSYGEHGPCPSSSDPFHSSSDVADVIQRITTDKFMQQSLPWRE
jgi:hypothetical protein